MIIKAEEALEKKRFNRVKENSSRDERILCNTDAYKDKKEAISKSEQFLVQENQNNNKEAIKGKVNSSNYLANFFIFLLLVIRKVLIRRKKNLKRVNN